MDFSADLATVYVDGNLRASSRWAGDRNAWSEDSSLTIANTKYAGYPWIGKLELLRIFDHGADADRARELFLDYREGVVNDSAFLALTNGAAGSLSLTGQDDAMIPMRIVEWPWLLKLRDIPANSIRTSNAVDLVANLCLTIPFGFGMASLAMRRPKAVSITMVVAATFLLSALAEFLQVFTPFRVPSFVDIAFNIRGISCGAIDPGSGTLVRRQQHAESIASVSKIACCFCRLKSEFFCQLQNILFRVSCEVRLATSLQISEVLAQVLFQCPQKESLDSA